jgi:D-alanyl-D-alanine dipeptidase
VTIGSMDSRIRVDLKYATTDNFMGRAIYPVASAALRRPVAAALLRAESALEAIGYGLLVYDAYRPWSITKLFWDLVPEEARGFVADPAIGSNHNRGCAVDTTLWDLGAGGPAAMPSRFDEPSERSATNYGGGTSLQRWNRDLLRIVMESEGFTAHPAEWWHFDHATYETSPLLDVDLQQLSRR